LGAHDVAARRNTGSTYGDLIVLSGAIPDLESAEPSRLPLSKSEVRPACCPSSCAERPTFRASTCCRRTRLHENSPNRKARCSMCFGCGVNGRQTPNSPLSSRQYAASAKRPPFHSRRNKPLGRTKQRTAKLPLASKCGEPTTMARASPWRKNR